MASDENPATTAAVSSCENDSNFAVICLFFDKFSKYLNLEHPNIERLQEMLENCEQVEPPLRDLHIKLLRKLRKTVHETAWETALCKFCWGFCAHDAWEIERFGYKKASIKVKLRVLRELVECQFERNGKFRSITEKMSAEEMRSEPIGRDKLGHSYWIAQDPDCNIRIYQEHSDEEIWQVVAKGRDELVTLINRLKGNEVVLPSSLIGSIDEDSSSNSCLNPPIKTESVKNDKSIKTETNGAKNVVENDNKVPNIKIKLPTENAETGETTQPEIIKADEPKENKVLQENNQVKLEIEENIEVNKDESSDSGSKTKTLEKTNEDLETKKEDKIKLNIKEIEQKNESKAKTFKDDKNSAEEEEEEYEEIGEEEYDEEEADDEGEEEEDCEEEETDNEDEKKSENKSSLDTKTDKTSTKIKKQIDERKVKPLVISQSKLTASPVPVEENKVGNKTLTVPKKRPIEIEEKEKETSTPIAKKARPTLLDAKRSKNVSKYEMFKNVSDDDEEEEEEEEEEEGEEEGAEEDNEENEAAEDETDEGDNESHEPEVSEAIEEKVLVVTGQGSGKDCEGSVQEFMLDLHDCDEPFFSEAIEEETFYVFGEGTGRECMVGNPSNNGSKESIVKKPLKEEECLNLSNKGKVKRTIENSSSELSKSKKCNDQHKALNENHDKKSDNSIDKEEKDISATINVIKDDKTLEKILQDSKTKEDTENKEPDEEADKNGDANNKENSASPSNLKEQSNKIVPSNQVDNRNAEKKVKNKSDSCATEESKIKISENHTEIESENSAATKLKKDDKVVKSEEVHVETKNAIGNNSKEILPEHKSIGCRKRRLIQEQKARPISESETDLNSENVEENEEEIENDEDFDRVGGKRPKMRNKIVNTSMRKKVEAQRDDVDHTSSSGSGSEEEKPRKKISPRKSNVPIKNNDKKDAEIEDDKAKQNSSDLLAPAKENDSSSFKWKKKLSSNKLDAKIASLKEAKEKVLNEELMHNTKSQNKEDSGEGQEKAAVSVVLSAEAHPIKEVNVSSGLLNEATEPKDEEKERTRKRSSPQKNSETNGGKKVSHKSSPSNKNSVIQAKSKINESDEEIPRKRTISEDASAVVDTKENKKENEITTDEEKHSVRKRAISDCEKDKNEETDANEDCPKKRTVNEVTKEIPKLKTEQKLFNNKVEKEENLADCDKDVADESNDNNVDEEKTKLQKDGSSMEKNDDESDCESKPKLETEISLASENLMLIKEPEQDKIKIVVKTCSNKKKKISSPEVTTVQPKRRGRSNPLAQQNTPIGKKQKTDEKVCPKEDIEEEEEAEEEEDPLKIPQEKEQPESASKSNGEEKSPKKADDTETKKEGSTRKPRKREIDASNIIDPDSDTVPMRQSRRIAQLKIREEAERRKMEEIALKKMKDDLRKRKKEEKQLMNDPTVSEPSSESSDSEKSSKKKFEKMKKKAKGKEGWSSGNSDEEEHDVDDDDLFRYPPSDHGSPLFKSDHEFSPESDIEDESQIVPLKRARTVRKEGEITAPIDSDEACQKCKKGDHPEWILLCDKCDKGYHCSCLSPVLFIIPEGDWFCPPCQQEQLIQALENHLKAFDELVIKRKEEEEEAEQLRIAELKAEEKRRELELEEQEFKKNRKSSKKKSTTKSKSESKKEGSADNSEESFGSSEVECSDDEVITKTKRQKVAEKGRNGRRKSLHSSSSNSNSSSSDNSSATDSDDEPIYKLRKRRQINISYSFNEYDDLINSAIKKEMDADAGAGNLGRGKDISTIIEADKEEKAKVIPFEEKKLPVGGKEPKYDDRGNTLKSKSNKSDSDSDFQPLKSKMNRKNLKKKSRKLNSLEISSEDDASDEDFKTSSEENDEDDDEDDDEYLSFDSDSSLEQYKRKKRNGKKKTRKAARRAARERRKVRDFVVEDSEDSDEDKPKTKKKKRKKNDSDYSETEETSESVDDEEDLDSDELCDDSTSSSDGNWKPGKRKKQKSSKSNKTKSKKVSKSKPESTAKPIKKVKKFEDDEKPYKGGGKGGGSSKSETKKSSGGGIAKKKLPLFDSSEETTDSDSEDGRKTRGKRQFYMDDFEDEDSSDSGIKPGVKRPDTPPEEREKFIKQQEEIKKRMQAEKEAKAKADAVAAEKEPEKTGSLSTVPLSVIRAAKALDVDYLQRKGETPNEDEEDEDDEAAAAAAFGDALPDDFNPDDMDEESIAKMMEEEDYAQNQLQFPPATDVLNKPKKGTTPIKAGIPELSQAALPVGSSSVSVIQDPTRKRLPMPTFNPLMRPHQLPSSHPLLQNALTNPGNSSLSAPNENDDQSKPRGRRKKITPLRDPMEKAAAAAAVTSSAMSKLTPNKPSEQKEAEPPLIPPPLSRLQNPDLNVAQPPQLYKPPNDIPQPSVITRMPQLPPRPRYLDQGSRYFAPQHPSNHSRIPPTLRHPMPPPHHSLRPSFVGGPPPLRSNLPPPNNSPLSLVNNRPLLPPSNNSPVNLGNRNNLPPPSHRGQPDVLGPQAPPSSNSSKNRQMGLPPNSNSNNIRPNRSTGPPNITPVNLGVGRSLGPRQPPPFTPEQYSNLRSRPPPHLASYRPPIFGAQGYPPPPSSQHPGLPYNLGHGGPLGQHGGQNPHNLCTPGSQGPPGHPLSVPGPQRHQIHTQAGPPISRGQPVSPLSGSTPGSARSSIPPRSLGPPNISIMPGPLQRLSMPPSHMGPHSNSSSLSPRMLGPPGPPMPRESHGPPSGYYPPPPPSLGHHLMPISPSSHPPPSNSAVQSSVIVSTSKAAAAAAAANRILSPASASAPPTPPSSLISTAPIASTLAAAAVAAAAAAAAASKINTLETFDSKDAPAPIDLHHWDNDEDHTDPQPPASSSVSTSSTSEFSGLVSYFSSQHDDFNT